MAKANSSASIEISRNLLAEITEAFRQAICNQESLLRLAKEPSIANDYAAAEALVISAERFNADMFGLYQRLNDLVEAEVQS